MLSCPKLWREKRVECRFPGGIIHANKDGRKPWVCWKRTEERVFIFYILSFHFSLASPAFSLLIFPPYTLPSFPLHHPITPSQFMVMSFTTKQLVLYDNEQSVGAIFIIQFNQLYTVRTLNHGEHEVLRVKQSDLKKILMVNQWVALLSALKCLWFLMCVSYSYLTLKTVLLLRLVMLLRRFTNYHAMGLE